MRRALVPILAVILSMLGCSGLTTREPVEATPEVQQTLTRYTREYVISPGDVLEVVIYRHEGLSRQVQVRGDGFISLPMIDEVNVAGMTIPALDEHLTGLFSERLVDPEVSVIVNNPPEPMVYVFGEVGAPKPVALRTARTAAQALAQASDFRKSAKASRVSVVRLNDEGQLVAYTLDNQSSGQPGFYMALQNFALQADDLLIVPESYRYQFFRHTQDFLGAINQVLTPYFQFRLLQEVESNN